MLYTLAASVLFPALAAAQIDVPAGTQLVYEGSVSSEEDRDNPRKTFDLTLIVSEATADGLSGYWLLDEEGRGEWPWAERFGRLALDAAGRHATGRPPSLLYDRGEEGSSVVAIPAPFLAADRPLADGLEWKRDEWTHTIERQTQLGGRDVWEIAVKNAFGPKRTVWLDGQSSAAVGLDERVFMGMGQEYQLRLRLVGAAPLDDASLKSLNEGFAALVALREAMKRPAEEQSPALSAEQLKLVEQAQPDLERLAQAGPLARLVAAIGRDVKIQTGRADAVGELAGEHLGQALKPFSLEGIDGAKLDDSALKGNVTVLHVWDYRDMPLEEPYGQVGYLDFLHQRREGQNVRTFGVVVDGRLADEATRGAAIRGVRRLKAFMNLSYPILLDEGELLDQLGDPRIVGAELPLFVVIDAEGKIAHYHVGFYEVDRDRGLHELDEVVGGLLTGTE